MAAPVFLGSLAGSVTLDGKDIHDLGLVRHRLGIYGMPEVEESFRKIAGRHGSVPLGNVFRAKRFVLEGDLHGDSRPDLVSRLDDLKVFLTSMKGRPWRARSGVLLETTDQPDRYWEVFYDGTFSWRTIGKDTMGDAAQVSIGLRCTVPFAIASTMSEVSQSSPAQYTFLQVPLGTAPSEYLLWLQSDGDDNPEIVVGDMIFQAHFDNDLDALDIAGTEVAGTYSATASEEYENYTPSEQGMQFHLPSGETLSFSSIRGNTDAWSCLIVFRPQYAYDTVGNKAVVMHWGDDDNWFLLHYNASADQWYWKKEAVGSQYVAISSVQSFAADTRFVMVCTFSTTNGSTLYINGVEDGTHSNTTALATAPTTVHFHDPVNAWEPDHKIDECCMWARELSADEALRYSRDPALVSRNNVLVDFASLAMAGGESITIDSEARTVVHLNASDEEVNVLGEMTDRFPTLTPPATCLYFPAACYSDVRLAYRKRWI